MYTYKTRDRSPVYNTAGCRYTTQHNVQLQDTKHKIHCTPTRPEVRDYLLKHLRTSVQILHCPTGKLDSSPESLMLLSDNDKQSFGTLSRVINARMFADDTKIHSVIQSFDILLMYHLSSAIVCIDLLPGFPQTSQRAADDPNTPLNRCALISTFFF